MNWGGIDWTLAFMAGLAGAVAPYVTRLILRRPVNEQRVSHVALTALIMGGLTLAAQFYVMPRLRSPFETALRSFEQRLATLPGLPERIKQAGSGADQLVLELARKGFKRLSDKQAIEYTQLMGTLIPHLSEHDCAEQFRGRGSVVTALRQVDSTVLQSWMDLRFAAIAAEHTNTPAAVPDPTEEEVPTALRAIRVSLPAVEGNRFFAILTQSGTAFEKANDTDTCWFLKTMIEALPRLDARSQQVVARVLTGT
jgi:hypothetical protein